MTVADRDLEHLKQKTRDAIDVTRKNEIEPVKNVAINVRPEKKKETEEQ